jgi:hypothetical protein
MQIEIRNTTGLVIPGEIYVNRNKKGHRSSNPRGDICKSPGITRPVAFLISIFIYLPWDYKNCGVSYFYLHMPPLGLLDL